MSGSGDEPEDVEEQNPLINVLQTITPTAIRGNFAVKFGLVLLVMALSIGLIGFIATQAVTGETEDNVKAEFQGDAGQQGDIVEQWLESNALQVEIMSDKGGYHQDREDVQLEIDNDVDRRALDGAGDDDIEQRLLDDFSHLHVLHDNDTHGLQVFASSDDSLEQDLQVTDFEDREWIVEAGNGQIRQQILQAGSDEVYVSETYMVGDEPHIGFISRSTVSDNRYLFMEMSVLRIQNSLRGGFLADEEVGFTQVVHNGTYQAESGTQFMVMMDARPQDGKLLETYSTREDTIEPIHLANQLREEPARAGVIAEMDPNEDVIDEVYTVGYAPIEHEDSEWVVLVHGARSDVFGFVDTLGTWGLIVTLFAVLLIGVTGAILGYSTSTSIDRLTEKTDEMREGNLDVNLYTSRIDNIGRLYDGFGDMRDALKQQIEESERARKEAEVARAEAEKMAEYLQEKAEEYSGIMQQVGAGDLTQRMTKDGEEESMDTIADEFNDMIEELEKTTGQLKSYVDEVEEAGSEVEQSATTVREASEQVADSIQKISDDAYDQKERLENISTAMADIAETLESYATEHPEVNMQAQLDEIQTLAADIDDLAELSEGTMAESEHVAGAAEEQAAELNEVSERANDLQRYAQPLRDILERFQTEAEHEFVFSVGPTGGAASPSSRDATEEESED